MMQCRQLCVRCPTDLHHKQRFLLQAGLIFAVEERLYSGEHEDMVSAAYPAFLVLASSGLGIALTARLAQVGLLV